MNNILTYCFLYILLFLICFFPAVGFTQFVNIQIDITPEAETTVEQALDFGRIIPGSGLQRIEPGDSNMGVFKLNALRTQKLLISLNADESLSHTNHTVTANIPVNLQARYTHNGINDILNSIPLSNSYENIIIEGPPANPFATWSAVYIYIFGTLNIGNVPSGLYSGKVVLTVVYE